MDNTAKLIAIILLASFAIERITASCAWGFDTTRLFVRRKPEEEALRGKEARRIALLVLAGGIAAAVVVIADLRILRVLNLTTASAAIDLALTWLVLFAGADRVGDFLKGAGGDGGAKPATPALRIQLDNELKVHEG